MDDAARTRVLYNDACPVCRAEIRHYARHAEREGLPIAFDDLGSDALAGWGVDADAAARRLHVLHDGRVSSGIPAFLVLWSRMPRYRWLARLVGAPVIRPLAVLVYDRVLAPALYRRHLRRIARGRAATTCREKPLDR